MAEKVEKVVEKVDYSKDSRELLEKLQQRRAELGKIVDPIRAERDKIVASMAPAEAKARELAQELKKYTPEMFELDNQISALSKVLGGKSMQTPPR